MLKTIPLGKVLLMAQTPVRPRKKRVRDSDRKYPDRPRVDGTTSHDTLTLGEMMRLRYGDEQPKKKKGKK